MNVAYAKDQLKPQIDLGVGYTTNGFAGNPVNPLSSPVTGLFITEASAIDRLVAIANKSLAPGQQLTPLPPLNFSSPGYVQGGLGQSFTNLQQPLPDVFGASDDWFAAAKSRRAGPTTTQRSNRRVR